MYTILNFAGRSRVSRTGSVNKLSELIEKPHKDKIIAPTKGEPPSILQQRGQNLWSY